MKAAAIEIRKAQALEALVAQNAEIKAQLDRIEAKLDGKKPASKGTENKPAADSALETAKE